MIERVLFIGSKAFGLSVASLIHRLDPKRLRGIVTFDDSADDRSVIDGFQEFGNDVGLPIEVAPDPRDLQEFVNRYRPDWCLVCGWYHLLPESLLKQVEHGFAGIHASALPRFRGSSPLVWAIIAGQPEVGVSFFRFGKGIDDGPIYFQRECCVDESDSIADVLMKVEHVTLDALEESYQNILNGSLRPKPQTLEGISYCAPRRPADGRIDWTKTAGEVHNFVRAQSHPYPGAFSYRGEARVVVWRAEPAAEPYYAQPGQLARRDGESIYIGCGGYSALRLIEVTVDGQREAPGGLLRTYQGRLL